MRFFATVVFCLVSICIAQAGNRQTILQFVQNQNHCQQQQQFSAPSQVYYIPAEPVRQQFRQQFHRQVQVIEIRREPQRFRQHNLQPVQRFQDRPRVTVERRGLFGLRQRVIVD